jgi:hypothetical protein
VNNRKFETHRPTHSVFKLLSYRVKQIRVDKQCDFLKGRFTTTNLFIFNLEVDKEAVMIKASDCASINRLLVK